MTTVAAPPRPQADQLHQRPMDRLALLRMARRGQSGDRRSPGQRPACRRRRSQHSDRSRRRGFPRMAPHSAGRPHPAAVQAEDAARRAHRRHRPHHHSGKRQDFHRSESRNAPRHRERRSRLRHSDDDARLQPRRRGPRHRRDDDPPAHRRHRRHRALQLSRHDRVLVSALRHRHGEYVHSQTERARAAHHALCLRAARKDWPAEGRRQSGQRRQGCGRRADRSSQSARHQLRGIDSGGALHLRALGRAGQTLPVPGRRQESRRRSARRRYADGHADHQRQRLRLRGATLPRRLDRDHDRRSAARLSATRSPKPRRS